MDARLRWAGVHNKEILRNQRWIADYVSDDAWLWLVKLNIGLRPTLSRLVSVKNLWNFTSLDEVHADLFFCLSVMSHRGFLTVNFTSCLFSCVAVDVQHEEFYTLCCHKHLVFFSFLNTALLIRQKVHLNVFVWLYISSVVVINQWICLAHIAQHPSRTLSRAPADTA